MKNWTIKRRVATGFGLVICIVLALGTFSLLRLTPINNSAHFIVSDCLPGVSAIGAWAADLKQNRALIQNYVLADSGPAKDKIGGEIQVNRDAIENLAKEYEKTVTQPEGQKSLEELKVARVAFHDTFSKVFDLSSADKKQEAVELFTGQMVPQYDKYLAAVEEQEKYNHDSANRASAEILSAVASARTGIWAGLICAFISALVLAFAIISSTTRALSDIVGKLERSTTEVQSSSESFSTSSMSFAEGASQQAASLEETSASLEEISSMTKRNAENAASCKQLSEQATTSAGAGLERLGEMSHTLVSIKSAVGDMESAVREMQGSSQEIAKIIKTIDEIAFQTNLLALNAAVEAARAGEAGMGFAVVADEVRALAQRSAQAARDTSDKIEHAIKRSELGGVASAKVVKNLAEVEGNAHNIEQVFNGIVAQIKSLNSVIHEISAASQEQSSGVGEVNMAVSQMDKVTQTNAAHAEENASAAAELHDQVAALRGVVAGLQTIVGGERLPTPEAEELAATAPEKQPARARQRITTSPAAVKRSAPVEAGSFENF